MWIREGKETAHLSCDWQDWGGSQDEKSYHCMVAGNEMEKYATGPKMSYEYWTESGMTMVVIICLDTKFIHPSHYKTPKVLVFTHGSTDGSREKENIYYSF